MHVGWAAVFNPPEDRPAPTFDELRAHIASRLDRAPRYRQKLAAVPLDLNTPCWIDADDFDISDHVRRAPTSDLDEAVAIAMSSPLARERPLWECWVVEGAKDGQIGVVGKAHHCMVDGLAAVELAAVLLDPTPDPPDADASGWRAAPAPSPLQRAAEGVVDRARDGLRLVSAPTRLVRSPLGMVRLVEDARRSVAALRHSLLPPATPAPVFNEPISPLRSLARVGRPVDDLVTIKSRFQTKLNDVVLAVCAGGVGRFLRKRGEYPVRLKAMVPVSVRAEEDELGNRISFMFIELPCDEPDPVKRLLDIHGATRDRKSGGEAAGAETVLNSVGYAPTVLQRTFTRLIASPRTFNLVVSNIPGPRPPMWMHGCELCEAYPVVPLADRHALSIGVTTVRDGAFFGLYADRKLLPDADVLAACLDESIDELLELAGAGRASTGPAPRATPAAAVGAPTT
jgi:WS/DGAT/MGAT family acyltransferase